MGQLVFQATLGGQVNLVGPNTASTFNLNVPAVSSTIATLTGTETFTNKTLTTPVISSLSSASATALTLQSAGTTAITVDTSQNVGVGTISPATKLQVSNTSGYSTVTVTGNSANGGILSFVDSAGVTTQRILGFGSTAGENTSLRFDTNGSERMRIDSSGNVKVANSTAVSGTNNVGNILCSNDISTGSFLMGVNGSFLGRQSSDGSTILNTGQANIIFSNGTYGSTTERMRIDSSGNLLVGETTQRGRISVTTGSDESIFAINSAGAASATMCSWNSANSGNNYFHAFFTDTGANNVGNIDYNRAAGLVRYNVTSDATLKNIIGDSNGQRSLEILNTTRIREFAWKSDVEQKTQIGVIAQELHETYKGAVSVGGDVEKTDENGNVTTEYRPWGVDKTAFTFHLIAGWQAHEKLIQEQQATINALTARIVALEAK